MGGGGPRTGARKPPVPPPAGPGAWERALVLAPGWAGLAGGRVSIAEATAAAGTANDAWVKPPLLPLLLLATTESGLPCKKAYVGCGAFGSPLVVAGGGPPEKTCALLLLSSPVAAARRKNCCSRGAPPQPPPPVIGPPLLPAGVTTTAAAAWVATLPRP